MPISSKVPHHLQSLKRDRHWERKGNPQLLNWSLTFLFLFKGQDLIFRFLKNPFCKWGRPFCWQSSHNSKSVLNSHNGGSKSKLGTILLQCLFWPVKIQAAVAWITTDHYVHQYWLAGLSSRLPFLKGSQHRLRRLCQLSKSSTAQMQLQKSSVPEAKRACEVVKYKTVSTRKLNSRNHIIDTDLLILLLIHLQSKKKICMLQERHRHLYLHNR